jgi:DNA-binding GntR family transcriptional regulator
VTRAQEPSITTRTSANQLAEKVYVDLNSEIFDFRLLPGDHFTETELARRYNVSRTPLRDALYRLRREGYLEVGFRSGWNVRAFDFTRYQELYELRALLELDAVRRLCRSEHAPDLAALRAVWEEGGNVADSDLIGVVSLDETFHTTLVELGGNREILAVYKQMTDQIRIIRRLGFLTRDRIDLTYTEHAEILRLIDRRDETAALDLLAAHIAHNQAEARKITLHMLYQARTAVQSATQGRADRAAAATDALEPALSKPAALG